MDDDGRLGCGWVGGWRVVVGEEGFWDLGGARVFSLMEQI